MFIGAPLYSSVSYSSWWSSHPISFQKNSQAQQHQQTYESNLNLTRSSSTGAGESDRLADQNTTHTTFRGAVSEKEEEPPEMDERGQGKLVANFVSVSTIHGCAMCH